MQQRTFLGINEAMAGIRAMQQGAIDHPGRPVALIIVDHHGEMVAFSCQANANAALARQNAFKKAYTSACMRAHLRDFTQRLKDQGSAALTMNPSFTSGLGGMVIATSDGVILGGIGVSGRTDQEDQDLADTGLGAVKKAAGIE